MSQRSDRPLTAEVALSKAQRYCAYQDRCHREVRSKLLDWGMRGDELEWIMAELITDKFLDEERFARSFARGKFRMKQWGRLRIVRELKSRQVTDYCIRQALTEIREDDYESTLHDLLAHQLQRFTQPISPTDYKKVVDYALRRGFEPELVYSTLRTLR